MKTNDEAANRFLENLKEQEVAEISPRDAVIDVSGNVSINRPLRCTFVFGGYHRAESTDTKKRAAP